MNHVSSPRSQVAGPSERDAELVAACERLIDMFQTFFFEGGVYNIAETMGAAADDLEKARLIQQASYDRLEAYARKVSQTRALTQAGKEARRRVVEDLTRQCGPDDGVEILLLVRSSCIEDCRQLDQAEEASSGVLAAGPWWPSLFGWRSRGQPETDS